jgi:carboxymethylenebutenolidase
MKASILGHFGEEDTLIPVEDVETFRANLATTSGDHAIYIYPNAGHAFSNVESDAFNLEAAELSWTRTLSFLEEEL